ncbi:MAG: cyclic nucleotide-binding domain-containing protein [Thermostichus sp. HHBFW_bins_43]
MAFASWNERHFHRLRWVLTVGWLVLIASLVYDPISPLLTDAERGIPGLRVDPTRCIPVQGQCLSLETSYGLGAPVFWGLVVPAAIFILLILGHDLWRRICPLSFLSQIPRALGIQRKVTKGKRMEVPRIHADSWLGKNHLYVQMAWFFLGLNARLLGINNHRGLLLGWLLITIFSALAVGFLYGGKSWCNYFCPMAPVQKIYGEPRALFTRPAHTDESKITQSMCRSFEPDGQEKSACVACQSPCIDIDAERTYWHGLEQPQQRLLYYGYVGLVVGYFVYYYLYAGNWEYYLSGVWAYEPGGIERWWDPGWYIAGVVIPVPKLLAVPVTLGAFTLLGYGLGDQIESWLQERWGAILEKKDIRHRLYSICTFFIFNFFFLFAGRSWLALLPTWVQWSWEFVLLTGSSFWLYRTWPRRPDQYNREGLATRLRKQLAKMQFNWPKVLEGRNLMDLNSDEIYVLAKVLPGFSQEKRLEAYKEVLRESLEEGYVNSSSSLQVLAQLRQQLDISEDAHQNLLLELGVEDPGLMDPNRLHSLENSVRLSGYRRALERMLALQSQHSLEELIARDPQAVRQLRQEYCITPEEEAEISSGLERPSGHAEPHRQAEIWQRAQYLLSQLQNLIQRFHALNQPQLLRQTLVLNLLRASVKQKKRLLVRALLEMIEANADGELNLRMAKALAALSPAVLPEVLENPTSAWKDRLPHLILQTLQNPGADSPACALDLSTATISTHLQALLQEHNPITQAISLYLLHGLDPAVALPQAQQLLSMGSDPLVKNTAKTLLDNPKRSLSLSQVPDLEKLTYLFNSQLFAGIHTHTLVELAAIAYFKLYQADDVITDEGDTCRELLILIEGRAQAETYERGHLVISSLLPGQILDELEVLSHGRQSGRITATHTPTRLLAIAVDDLDLILERDPDLSRRILEWESSRLQQLLHSR